MRGGAHNVRTGRAQAVSERELRTYFARIAERIRDARLERDISQRALAEAAGLRGSSVCEIERGYTGHGPYRQGVAVGTLIRIARALGINPSELMP